jgi:adenosine deaminase
MEAFIARLPKAELHVHIEGTLEPEHMFALAARNRVALPFRSAEEARNAYRFNDLQGFLDLYYQGMSVLLAEEDFYDLTLAYLEKADAQGVVHAEIFFDPQAHVARGIPFRSVVNGIRRAQTDAYERFGLSTRLIACFLRHLEQEDALDTFKHVLRYADWIVGVGLDSSERGHPPRKFKDVFDKARAEGFRLVAHAGEEGPADYVREALDVLRVDRIDHGNRALEDAALVERLARDGVALTVCPLSNVKLGVVKDIARHPIAEMIDKKLVVTVNSDDPAYFGGYINENFLALRRSLDLSRDLAAALARNSIRASFLPDAQKARLLGRLASYLDAN